MQNWTLKKDMKVSHYIGKVCFKTPFGVSKTTSVVALAWASMVDMTQIETTLPKEADASPATVTGAGIFTTTIYQCTVFYQE